MITVYTLDGLKLKREEEFDEKVLSKSIWIDLLDSSEDDRRYIEENLNINITSKLGLLDIEASARFFEDEDGIHLHSFFYYTDEDGYADLETVAFTIQNDQLYSLRMRELTPFRLYRLRSLHDELLVATPYEILIDIFETKIEQIADLIEDTYSSIEELTRKILVSQNRDLDKAIEELTHLEDMTSKINSLIMDTNRALKFIGRKVRDNRTLEKQVANCARDLESVKPSNDLLFSRINFLMDAAMSFVNIEQNKIIKMFSILSVLFMPPTMIASMYGMNFQIMPELSWEYGYLFAIGLMISSAALTYLFFKWKRWF